MKILVFLHGTVIMHRSAAGKPREERVRQVREREESVHDYASYIPVERAVEKLKEWEKQGVEILYFSSHETVEDVEKDKTVLRKYSFPEGPVFFRRNEEKYRDVVERIMPDVLIEDDCESIGGESQMIYPRTRKEIKGKIKHLVVKEFGGIDHLPDYPVLLKRTV